MPQNRRLISDICKNITDDNLPPVRPVRQPNDKFVVQVQAALYQIVDLDQENNLATVSAYFDISWFDVNVAWDPANYGGANLVYVPAKMVWIPEFYLYHSVQGSTPLTLEDAAVQVNSTGGMRAFVPFTARALCPINVKHFPFDRQVCMFKFGSWSYTSDAVEYMVSSQEVYLGDFYDNQEWLLIDSRLFAGKLEYVTEEYNESYGMVTMELTLQRQSFYYVFNLVMPVTLVSLVAVIGFHSPMSADGRRMAKFRLGIMTLLSMGVMLLMVVDDMPKFGLESVPGQRGSFSDPPLLGMFYLCLICNISISTCTVTIFIVMERYALQHPLRSDMPVVLRWLDFDWPWQRVKSIRTPPAQWNHAQCSYECAPNHAQAQDGRSGTGGQTVLGAAAASGMSARREDTSETALSDGLALQSHSPKTPARPAPHVHTPGKASSQHKHQPQQQMQFAQLGEQLVAAAAELRHAVGHMQSCVEGMREATRGREIPQHWKRAIDRCENLSLYIFLGVIAFAIAMLYFGPEVY